MASPALCATLLKKRGKTDMLDLFYIVVGCISLLLCWAFTKACDKL